jgi:DNA polymerase (family 10)
MPSYKVGMSQQEAKEMASELTDRFTELGARKVEVSGSLRRGEKEIGDLDLIVDGDILSLAKGVSCDLKEIGSQRVTMLYRGQQVNVFYAGESNWGAMQFYLCGPTNYCIGYRMKAKNLGMKLDQHGLWKDGKVIASKTEQEIYLALGKVWKKPEDRGK